MLALAINAQAGREPKSDEAGKKETEEKFGDRINAWINLGQAYRPDQWIVLFDKETVPRVFELLEQFHKRAGEIEELMDSGDWIPEKKRVISDPDTKLSLQDRCWFHAVTLFCQGRCGVDREWFRVVRNLITYTDLRNITDFPHTIRSLDKLAELMKPGSLQGLAVLGDDEMKDFGPGTLREQLREERTKARLLSDADAGWGEIRDAEKHEFLRGQIGILLVDSEDEDATVDAGAFAKRWETFRVLMDRGTMNPFIPGSDTDDACLDRNVIRAVLARCEQIKCTKIWLPWMKQKSQQNGLGWREALKRNADIKQFQKGLLTVIDELIATGSPGNLDLLVKGLTRIASSPLISQVTWMRNLVEHGDVILKGSEHWKMKFYHRWWSHDEKALFVYHRKNVNEPNDVLVGDEFEVRNKLLAKLVETEWELAQASKIRNNDVTTFSGHHPELRRDGRKMVFFYQSIELDVDGQNGQKERVHFMDGENPREISDVLEDLKKHGLPV